VLSLSSRGSFLFGTLLVMLVMLAHAIGCGAGTPEKIGKYPTRPEGCNVQVFAESPSMPTDNIGPVNAVCGEDISVDDCVRTLKDATCKLGGDVVWGVGDVPSTSVGKWRLNGRAAHTQSAGAAANPTK
jgi:hypothetical protein